MPIVDKTPLVLVLDIGTSMLKVALVSPNGNFVGESSEQWGYQSGECPGALSFEPLSLLTRLEQMVKGLPHPAAQVSAIMISSQRLGFVLIDRDGKPLLGIPNIDRRASQEGQAFQDDSFLSHFQRNGRWPGAQHLITKLQWLRKHQPDVFSKIGKILSISDWLVRALCGETLSEPTTACESGLLDIHTLRWSESLLGEAGLDPNLFARIIPTGQPVGTLLSSVAEAMGLSTRIKVLMGGGDTELGMLGAGCIDPGDMAVVAGSSAPVNAVFSSPEIDPGCKMITNPHVVQQRWVMEANAMLTGLSFSWVKEMLFGDEPDGFHRLNDLASDYLKSVRHLPQMALIAGASTADARRGNLYPDGLFSFSMSDFNSGAINRGAFAFSAYESVAYAIVTNASMLSLRVGQPKRLVAGGGETQSSLLMTLLASLSPAPVYRVQGKDLTCLGAAVLAFTSMGHFNNLQSAVKAMVHTEPVPIISVPFHEEMAGRMSHWNDSFQRFHLRV